MCNSRNRVAVTWGGALVMFASVGVACDIFWTRCVISGSDSFEAAKVSRLIALRSPEIPIFGASKARADYVPGLIHPAAFNYGMDAASYEVIDLLLHIELAKNKAGPLIIDMNHQAFRGIGDVSKLIPFTQLPEVKDLLKRDGSMQWRFNIPGIRYFGFYDWYLKDFLAERYTVTRRVDRGYTTTYNRLPWDRSTFDAAIKKRLETGYGFKDDPSQDERLFRHIRHAPRRKFVLVYAPVHASCFVNFTGAGEFAQFLVRLRGLDNVVVLDWSRLHFPDEYFADTVHLNERGAIEFSRRLGAELRPVLSTSD
jgi:hypothetical protein